MRQRDRDAAANVLDKAADLLSKRGAWQKGGYTNSGDPKEQTCFCALGAISKAATGNGVWNEAKYPSRAGLARDALYQVIPNRRVVYYNDHVAKDKRYVIRKMRKAAELLRKGELL